MGGETVIIGFEESAFDQYREWSKKDKNVFKKLDSIITDIMRDPFHGLGKPEPLKGNLSGHWSRRITDEHRLVYQVFSDHVVIVSCKYHYK